MARRGVLGGSKVLTSAVVDVETLAGSFAPAQFEACAVVPRFPRVAGGLLDEWPTMNVNLDTQKLDDVFTNPVLPTVPMFHRVRASPGRLFFFSLRGDEDSASMSCAFIQGVC